MSDLFSIYKKWREQTDSNLIEDEAEDVDKKAFMRYAKLKKLDYDDFEELEMQYDEYLIEKEEIE